MSSHNSSTWLNNCIITIIQFFRSFRLFRDRWVGWTRTGGTIIRIKVVIVALIVIISDKELEIMYELWVRVLIGKVIVWTYNVSILSSPSSHTRLWIAINACITIPAFVSPLSPRKGRTILNIVNLRFKIPIVFSIRIRALLNARL